MKERYTLGEIARRLKMFHPHIHVWGRTTTPLKARKVWIGNRELWVVETADLVDWLKRRGWAHKIKLFEAD